MATQEPRFSMRELVEASGMTERKIRYYIERGLLPGARGRGRSAYYTTDHLRTIERIRGFQELGLSLDEIASELRSSEVPAVDHETWLRVRLHADLEVHVRRDAPESVHILVRRFQDVAREWFGSEDAEF